MGSIQIWYLELINVIMIADLVSIGVSLFLYSMMQGIRDVTAGKVVPTFNGTSIREVGFRQQTTSQHTVQAKRTTKHSVPLPPLLR